jgi:hypothetical protein
VVPRQLSTDSIPDIDQEVASSHELAVPDQPDIGSAADDFRSALD